MSTIGQDGSAMPQPIQDTADMMTQLATAGEGGEEDDSDEDDRELMPGEEVEEDEAEEESESDGDGEMIVLDPDHVRKI